MRDEIDFETAIRLAVKCMKGEPISAEERRDAIKVLDY